jgi:hypothetical protein
MARCINAASNLAVPLPWKKLEKILDQLVSLGFTMKVIGPDTVLDEPTAGAMSRTSTASHAPDSGIVPAGHSRRCGYDPSHVFHQAAGWTRHLRWQVAGRGVDEVTQSPSPTSFGDLRLLDGPRIAPVRLSSCFVFGIVGPTSAMTCGGRTRGRPARRQVHRLVRQSIRLALRRQGVERDQPDSPARTQVP